MRFFISLILSQKNFNRAKIEIKHIPPPPCIPKLDDIFERGIGFGGYIALKNGDAFSQVAN